LARVAHSPKAALAVKRKTVCRKHRRATNPRAVKGVTAFLLVLSHWRFNGAEGKGGEKKVSAEVRFDNPGEN